MYIKASFRVCICLILVSQITSGFTRSIRNSSPDFNGYSKGITNRIFEFQTPDSDWRNHKRQLKYLPANPKPPSYYNYTTYTYGYKPQKPFDGRGSDTPSGPTVKFGGTGISGAIAGECAPGIPKCFPRVGRSISKDI